MEETVRKLILACACLLAVTAIAGCGSDDSTTASSTETTTQTSRTETETTTTDTTTTAAENPTVVNIVVVNASPQGGIVRQTVNKGDRVVLVVKSDVADEIHLHGYDLSRDVAAGGTARLPFTATLPGRFEVELESRGVQIADLTVNG
jgi:ABC-type glycerol-3-phosphate transport system substrate-binding protein